MCIIHHCIKYSLKSCVSTQLMMQWDTMVMKFIGNYIAIASPTSHWESFHCFPVWGNRVVYFWVINNHVQQLCLERWGVGLVLRVGILSRDYGRGTSIMWWLICMHKKAPQIPVSTKLADFACEHMMRWRHSNLLIRFIDLFTLSCGGNWNQKGGMSLWCC